jgi:hypothetical protein
LSNNLFKLHEEPVGVDDDGDAVLCLEVVQPGHRGLRLQPSKSYTKSQKNILSVVYSVDPTPNNKKYTLCCVQYVDQNSYNMPKKPIVQHFPIGHRRPFYAPFENLDYRVNGQKVTTKKNLVQPSFKFHF